MKALDSAEDHILMENDNTLRATYFMLKNIVQEFCSVPLNELDRIRGTVLRADDFENRLRYYEIKLNRTNNPDVKKYILRLKERELSTILS